MEEVVGSIPTRSTNSLNNLDWARARSREICVMVCVITRRFGAHGKSFHRMLYRSSIRLLTWPAIAMMVELTPPA